MKPLAVPTVTGSPLLKPVRKILGDALYRGSFYLLANTVTQSAIGFVFWTLAAHRYSASAVGVFSGVTSGASLLAAVAALGLPLTMTRHIAGAANPRELVVVSISVIATVGTVLCLATIIFLGPHFPSALHLKQHGGMAFLVTILVVFIAAGTTLDAGLVAMRATRVVLIKNFAGSIVKLAVMVLLTASRSSGLLLAFGLGLVLSTTASGVALSWRIRGKQTGPPTFSAPWRYLSATSGNYLATVIGILPLTIVPIEVLAVRGAAETARFSIAFLIAGFLNFIPSTTGQVLFAELARGEAPLGKQLRKALRAVYGLLLPSLAFLLLAAPFVLRLFGQAYAAEATGCLRVLALSALPAGGTYLVDSILISRDRTTAYTFMQIANAALVLGLVGFLLPRGLTAAACGWAVAQGLTLLLGMLIIATGTTSRHRPRSQLAQTAKAPNDHEVTLELRPLSYAFEPQVRQLLTAWPTMPTTLIAERIGWDPSSRTLLERVTELRRAHSDPDQPTGYLAGEIAQCSLWFPPVTIPVGYGQRRSAQQLPVLTMITGYSHWLSAILIPTRRPEDLFAGWWELLVELGAVPRLFTSPSEDPIGWWSDGQTQITAECRKFCRSLNTAVTVGRVGDPRTTGMITQAHVYLERAFLRDRIFHSPEEFNNQLHDWLAMENARSGAPPGYVPDALIAADREAMIPLPPIPPATGWRLSRRIGEHPFIDFDSNKYAVNPALTGQTVEIVADLRQVRVLCDRKVVAEHNRAWAHNRTIRAPTY